MGMLCDLFVNQREPTLLWRNPGPIKNLQEFCQLHQQFKGFTPEISFLLIQFTHLQRFMFLFSLRQVLSVLHWRLMPPCSPRDYSWSQIPSNKRKWKNMNRSTYDFPIISAIFLRNNLGIRGSFRMRQSKEMSLFLACFPQGKKLIQNSAEIYPPFSSQ